MKPLRKPRIRALTVFVSCCFVFLISVQDLSAANTIGGFVFDRGRTPLHDIDVELLDEYYRLKARTKTETSGRFRST